MLLLERFSFGIGDRFAHQAKAQLRAFEMLAERGVQVAPVWNKSHREHTTIGSQPTSVLAAAQAAVAESGWSAPYHVDADHIRLETVEGFLESSDFYTLDVADYIGQRAPRADVETFVSRHPELIGTIHIQDIASPIVLLREDVAHIVAKYLLAIQQAGRIYRFIAERKGQGTFITEVSIDETDMPQTPPRTIDHSSGASGREHPVADNRPQVHRTFQ